MNDIIIFTPVIRDIIAIVAIADIYIYPYTRDVQQRDNNKPSFIRIDLTIITRDV